MGVAPLDIQELIDDRLQLIVVLPQETLVLLSICKSHGNQFVDGGLWGVRPLPLPVHQVGDVVVLYPPGIVLERGRQGVCEGEAEGSVCEGEGEAGGSACVRGRKGGV